MFTKFPNVANYKFNAHATPSYSNLMQPSLIQEFYHEEVTYFDGDDKKTAVKYHDDLYMLFNQSRIASLGVDTLNKWLDTLTPRSDALGELRKKCTDEQLMAICKSRFIQSPSELLAWSEYLNVNYASVLASIQKQNEKPVESTPEPAPEPTPEPSPTPTNS